MHRKKIPETGCGTKLNQTHTQVAEHACTLSEIISINVHTLCPRVCVCVSVVTRERERAEKAIHPMITVNTLLQSTHTHTHTHGRSVCIVRVINHSRL